MSARTMEKWASPPRSGDRREMPLIARKLLVRLLDDRKRERLAAGDRKAAEAIDALAAHIDPARLEWSLRQFDALQGTARRLAVAVPVRSGKPKAFATFAAKNAWQREEEATHARAARAASARSR
ncbi:MAG: hypothetical protein OEX21_00105 [Betaproteobacteria bacterium]|nr:hypothetical protein [Betaproteobacteria bacterium]